MSAKPTAPRTPPVRQRTPRPTPHVASPSWDDTAQHHEQQHHEQQHHDQLRRDNGEARQRARHRAQVWASVTVLLAAMYGLFRTSLVVTGVDSGPTGTELAVGSGWGSIVLCVLAGGLAGAMVAWPARGAARVLVAAGALVTSGVLGTSALVVLLEWVGHLLPGLGIAVLPLGAASRVLCLALGVSLAASTYVWLVATGSGCPRCGRTRRPPRADTTPSWAYVGAAVAVAGFLTLVLAQDAVGQDTAPSRHGTAALVFELGIVLGGVLLPCALVYAWGRRWPGWVPGLAGRRVPRWLVLGPAAATALVVLTSSVPVLGVLIWAEVAGRGGIPALPGVPETSVWVMVPASVAWGAGLAVTAVAYHARTRPRCRSCGR